MQDSPCGEVTSVQRGNAIAYVKLKIGNLQLGGTITSEALDELPIDTGDRVTAVAKATEIMVQNG
ncbi:TOBE domain-containing protein [Nitrospira sp. Nam74]